MEATAASLFGPAFGGAGLAAARSGAADRETVRSSMDRRQSMNPPFL
jgi:hypothetical protein